MAQTPIDKTIQIANSPEDYYIDKGLMVMTAAYLLKRGHCCNSGCRHCPYKKTDAPKILTPNGKNN